MTRKDQLTADLPGVPKRRGRPPTGKAMSDSERQARRRQKLADEGRELVTVDLSSVVVQALNRYILGKDITLGQAVDRLIAGRLKVALPGQEVGAARSPQGEDSAS